MIIGMYILAGLAVIVSMLILGMKKGIDISEDVYKDMSLKRCASCGFEPNAIRPNVLDNLPIVSRAISRAKKIETKKTDWSVN
jgi:hypothetical protein